MSKVYVDGRNVLLHVPTSEGPPATKVCVMVDVGFIDYDRYPTEMAHYVEHILSQHRGMAMHGVLENAMTALTKTFYYGSSPDVVLTCLFDAINGACGSENDPVWNNPEWRQQRQLEMRRVTAESINMYDHRQSSRIFGDMFSQPRGKWWFGGENELYRPLNGADNVTFSNLARSRDLRFGQMRDADVRNFIREFYTKENIAVFTVIGGGTAASAASVRKLVAKKWESLRPGENPTAERPSAGVVFPRERWFNGDSRFGWIDHADGHAHTRLYVREKFHIDHLLLTMIAYRRLPAYWMRGTMIRVAADAATDVSSGGMTVADVSAVKSSVSRLSGLFQELFQEFANYSVADLAPCVGAATFCETLDDLLALKPADFFAKYGEKLKEISEYANAPTELEHVTVVTNSDPVDLAKIYRQFF